MIKNITNLGDAALYCNFGSDISKETNSLVINYFKNIRKKNILGITNIVPSYNKLIVTFDLNLTNFKNVKTEIENLNLKSLNNERNKLIKIPICCDNEFALDINNLEKKIKIPKDQILKNFFSKEYFCYMTGFIAGLPFLGDLDESLKSKRLETPRVKIPKGSIGLAEQFCNIYTSESPGGWNIIGNTPVNIFDKKKEIDPNLINPGDTVIFQQISMSEYEEYNN